MPQAYGPLPNFEKPPVIEVVCGILFKPINSLLVPHFGLLWEKFRDEYPTCREVPPLNPLLEQYDNAKPFQIELSDTPPLPRIWFVHKNDTGVIQIQRDRFLHNWRKVHPEDEYPRYHKVMEMYKKQFSKFESFLTEHELGSLEPQQYEMTYINHMYQGYGWNSTKDVGALLPDFSFRNDPKRFLPAPESINWRTGFALPNREGRLHATVRHGKLKETAQSLIILDLTVRGIGTDRSLEGMAAWFDLAREWIVRGFVDLTGTGRRHKRKYGRGSR